MIKRGTIYWVDFNPVQGKEIGKIRPAVVVSNNINNQYNATVNMANDFEASYGDGIDD